MVAVLRDYMLTVADCASPNDQVLVPSPRVLAGGPVRSGGDPVGVHARQTRGSMSVQDHTYMFCNTGFKFAETKKRISRAKMREWDFFQCPFCDTLHGTRARASLHNPHRHPNIMKPDELQHSSKAFEFIPPFGLQGQVSRHMCYAKKKKM